MRGRWRWLVPLAGLILVLGIPSTTAGLRVKGPPPLSGFHDYRDASAEFELGLGRINEPTCSVGASTQPAVYAGNSLLDCDAEVPHNETSITVNPVDPNHAVAAFHSYQLIRTGNAIHATIVSAISASFDGGVTWRETFTPLAPYQFSGDPAVAFGPNGRVYLASIADHEGDGGFNFTSPSVVTFSSDDGGRTWMDPVTVAPGKGAAGSAGVSIFQDKEFIAVDAGAGSPFRSRAYVTWTSFRFNPGFAGAPILVSTSDDGQSWTAPQRIAATSPFCTTQFGGGGPNDCDANQFSVPTVAPNGTVYVALENFNTPAENQLFVVRSTDGGATWSGPARVDTLFDINLPENASGRSTLTGCQLRWNVGPSVAADPSDPTGRTVVAAWADNRNGTNRATNTDVVVARSTDGGATWKVSVIDKAANDQFYPWVAVAPSGRVDVGYMDRSYSGGQRVCQYGFALTRLSFDSRGRIVGKTKARLDTGLSDPGASRWFSAATNGNSVFIGDYNGVAVGSDGRTWAAWTDQRALVADPPAPNRNHGQHAVGATLP